jgi:hypothetical protein
MGKDLTWDPEEHRRRKLMEEGYRPVSQFILDMVPAILPIPRF